MQTPADSTSFESWRTSHFGLPQIPVDQRIRLDLVPDRVQPLNRPRQTRAHNHRVVKLSVQQPYYRRLLEQRRLTESPKPLDVQPRNRPVDVPHQIPVGLRRNVPMPMPKQIMMRRPPILGKLPKQRRTNVLTHGTPPPHAGPAPAVSSRSAPTPPCGKSRCAGACRHPCAGNSGPIRRTRGRSRH